MGKETGSNCAVEDPASPSKRTSPPKGHKSQLANPNQISLFPFQTKSRPNPPPSETAFRPVSVCIPANHGLLSVMAGCLIDRRYQWLGLEGCVGVEVGTA